MTKKTITPKPIFEALEKENPKGLTDTSWVIISASSGEKTEVLFFNPESSPEEYESFKDFVEANMDDFYCKGDNVEKTKKIEDNFATISAYSGDMEEDFDEDSGKSWTAPVGYGAIMDFYKGGINLDKLPELVAKMEKDLDNLESEGAYEAKDSHDFQKDPYAYYGVSRRDFF